MAITAALCVSYKKECFRGVHSEADVYKIALYTSSASLDYSTSSYSITNEVTGVGYTAGGLILSGMNVNSSGNVAWLDFTTDPSWPSSSITARGALIYNSSKDNRAVAVLDFGADKVSTDSTFLITFPFPDSTHALIRWT
jgi:hypothetical protein